MCMFVYVCVCVCVCVCVSTYNICFHTSVCVCRCVCVCVCICLYAYIVHHESFRSNAQSAIVFACRNRSRLDRNDEFACVNLRLRAFASTVRNRPRALSVLIQV